MTENGTKARLIMSQFISLTSIISTATLQNNSLPESLFHFRNRNSNLGQKPLSYTLEDS